MTQERDEGPSRAPGQTSDGASESPPALDYRPASADSRPRPVLSVLACFITMALVMGTGFVAILFMGTIGIAAIILMIAGLTVTAASTRKNPATRWMSQGIWAGIGIAMLIEGLCFATLY